MVNRDDERMTRFLGRLRRDGSGELGRGVGRFARLLRGGVGLAGNVVAAARRGGEATLGERELARLEQLVAGLGELKGLPMKLGQILSYLELDLPEEARALMALLQRQSPATPWPVVEAVVRDELGSDAEALLAGLERSPVSIASIGQVYRGRLPDGAEVAVKVRHPAIDEAIRSDLRAARVGTGVGGLIVPGMGATARDFVAELEARLLEECDYRLEAERQRTFAALFAAHPVILVPAVHGRWCGPRVLTTSWADGQDFETFRLAASQERRNRAGEALFDFYVGALYRHGLFHADPHPGNYEFRADGRVVVFDYGCVREFEPEVARAFAALAAAVRADDRARIVAALAGLGAKPSADDAAFQHLRGLLRSFFGPLLRPGPRPVEGRIVVDMGQVMRDKLALARLRLPGRMMFLFRIRFGLYAVLSRLGAVCDWAALEQRFAAES